MIRQLCIAIIVTALVSTPAAASDWKYVTTADSGTIVYVDTESIREINDYSGTYRLAWSKWDYSENKTTKDREAKILRRFKCISYESALQAYAIYLPDGSVRISETVKYPNFNAEIPDSIGYSTLQFVCSK